MEPAEDDVHTESKAEDNGGAGSENITSVEDGEPVIEDQSTNNRKKFDPEQIKSPGSESDMESDDKFKFKQVFQDFSRAIKDEIHKESTEPVIISDSFKSKKLMESADQERSIDLPEQAVSKEVEVAMESAEPERGIDLPEQAVSKEVEVAMESAEPERGIDLSEQAVSKEVEELRKKREAEEKEREKQEREKIVPYVEAALFLAGRPIGEMELAEHLGSDRLTIRWALRRVTRTLQEQNSALEILNPTKDRWVLQLCEEFSRGLYEYIEQFIPKEAMLSPEEIETLTEIAYRQPITSALLAKISGRPTIYDNMKTLHEKGFITMEKQERTNLLKTSKKFADIYGFDTEMRNLKIQLVWRLKKRAKLEKV